MTSGRANCSVKAGKTPPLFLIRPFLHEINQHHQVVAQAAGHDKDMEYLMKTEHFTDVRFFDSVNDAADGVEYATCRKQGYGAAGKCAQGGEVHGDEPAHQNIEGRTQCSGRFDPDKLHDDAGKGKKPNEPQKDIVFRFRQDGIKQRCIGTCDEDVDHGMIQLTQALDDFRLSIYEVIETAGAVEACQGCTEYQSGQLCAVEIPEEYFHRHDEGTANGQDQSDKMSIAAERVSGS